MRLLELEKFPPAAPEDSLRHRPYAILSHVWEDVELTYGDLQDPEHADALPIRKIRGAQEQAKKDSLNYLWTDTCCIDKSSSAELGEAINSMYRWYQEADVCYVYLADLDGCPPLTDADLRHGGETTSQRYWNARFREAKWFSRGWTLQELIAPSKLRFYDRDWNLIGDLKDLATTVSEITGVHLSMLHHTRTPQGFSVAQRMCWAAGRETTRPEDRAYSLLGLLDMSIDIRYGEGQKAFTRLQEAIIERSADQSIFAWEKNHVKDEDIYVKEQRRDSYIWLDEDWSQLLAPSPDAFVGAHNIVPSPQPSLPYRMTNVGLKVTAQIEKHDKEWMLLNCYDREDPTKAILLNLKVQQHDTQQQKNMTVGHVWLRHRVPDQELSPISRLSYMNVDRAVKLAKEKEMYIATSRASSGHDGSVQKHFNVWLQIAQRGNQPNLFFNTSEPKMNDKSDSFTWKLEGYEEVPSPRPAAVTFSLVYATKNQADSANTPITLRLDLSDKHAFIQFTGHEMGRRVVNTTKIFFSETSEFDRRAQLKLFPGIEISATIHREYLNGQQWHIVKVLGQQVPVRLRPIRSMWHSLKKTNCRAAPDNG